ncbi:hypothetical protein [Marinobacter sp.]|uniref:hypothetical protein n=1 Tax=Marinobacter sp. TaxID=50741 RepID=UPI0035C72997|nr:hypothetical protein [Oleiphilaceae bacterium]
MRALGWIGLAAWLLALLLVLLPLMMPVQARAEGNAGAMTLSVEGISASVGEDNPRVLFILPWQAPSLPRRPKASLDGPASDLMAPIDPLTLERHRVFRHTLDPLVLSPKRGLDSTSQSYGD